MVKKVLPPLNEQNQVPNIATSGEWKAEDATFLEKLAKGLKMGGEEIVSATDIVSVPDVWARVLIVRNGLLDNNPSIVNEWRGTLALLGLAPYYKHIYDLSSSIVNIQDIKKSLIQVMQIILIKLYHQIFLTFMLKYAMLKNRKLDMDILLKMQRN